MTKFLRESRAAIVAALLAALLTSIFQPLVSQAAIASRSSALPKWHIRGLAPRWVSATTVTIETGECRSADDTTDMALTSEVTADIAGTSGAINCLDSFTLTGGSTFATNSGNATVTATGSAFLTNFAPAGAPRALTGTIGTGGSGTTTITGSSSKFLTEVSIGDLIGSSTVGYAKVTAVASDTSLTVVSNLTITNGHAGKVLENPTIQVAAQTAQRINAIASDTSLTLAANSSATQSSQAAKAGVEIISEWLPLWFLTGTSGSGSYLSTQRTTLFAAPSGYALAKRRVSYVRNDASGNLAEFAYDAASRTMAWEYAQSGNSSAVVNGGAATTWTAVDCSAVVAPSTRRIDVVVSVYKPTTADTSIFLRQRGTGVSTTTRNNGVSVALNSTTNNTMATSILCDGVQAIDYVMSVTPGSSGYVFVLGWRDDVTR